MEIWRYIKEHVTSFFAGFVPCGTIVFSLLYAVPPLLGVVGFILKLCTTVLFAAAGGLATVLVTDLYNTYGSARLKRAINAVTSWFKRKPNERKSDSNKAA